MAFYWQSSSYPNVLVVYGSDVVDASYRQHVYDYLTSADARDAPVRAGTHAFWITYATPSQGGGNYSGPSDSARPHALFGTIRMPLPGATGDTAAMRRHLRVLLQEVGHHWLVPADFGFTINGKRTLPLHQDELLAAIGTNSVGNGLALVGRGDAHWSVYFQADGSPLDGQDWRDQGSDHGFDHWKWVEQSGPRVTPKGLAELELLGAFNDLDLCIMGAVEPRQAYPGSGGRIRWMAPVLTAPLQYQSGVMVAFSRSDMLYFGFSGDHRQLAVTRTSSSLAGSVIAHTPIHPIFPPTGVLLRVVRIGNDYHFQARADRTVGLHLSPEPRDLGGLALASRASTIPGLFDGADSPPAASPNAALDAWRTIAKVTDTRAPQAVGLITRKWKASHLCETAFFNLEIQTGGSHAVHRFSRAEPLGSLGGGALNGAPRDRPVLDLPNDAAWVRYVNDHVLLLGAPYGGKGLLNETISYDDTAMPPNGFGHSSSIDHAPKVVLRAPSGDFAFGTAAMMYRTLQPPQAAGDARDTEMWGHAYSVKATDLSLGAGPTGAQIRRSPTSLPCAFIVAARTRADGEALLPRVDEVRRYWEATIAAATRGAIAMPTSLAR
jgi:hypothetical protein